jgi:hypothetical protein
MGVEQAAGNEEIIHKDTYQKSRAITNFRPDAPPLYHE